MRLGSAWLVVVTLGLPAACLAEDAAEGVVFKKLVLTDKYYCDGLAAGDVNCDGRADVVAGPWYGRARNPAITAFWHRVFDRQPSSRSIDRWKCWSAGSLRPNTT